MADHSLLQAMQGEQQSIRSLFEQNLHLVLLGPTCYRVCAQSKPEATGIQWLISPFLVIHDFTSRHKNPSFEERQSGLAVGHYDNS